MTIYEVRGLVMESLFTEAGLRKFISRKKFQLFLQPQVSMKTGAVTGAEASVRLKTKNRIIPISDRFFGGLKQGGVFYLLDLHMLRLVCRQLTEWQNCYLEPVEISVKLSPCTMEREDISEQIEKLINEYPHVVPWLRIQVSETSQIQNWELFLDNCRKLALLGIGLSADGYGSRMTENSLIMEPWFDEIRIDESLTQKIERRTMDFLKVTVILDICRREGKQVVAEGVRHEEQCRVLRNMGCGRMEGEFAGEPLAAGRFEYKYLDSIFTINII